MSHAKKRIKTALATVTFSAVSISGVGLAPALAAPSDGSVKLPVGSGAALISLGFGSLTSPQWREIAAAARAAGDTTAAVAATSAADAVGSQLQTQALPVLIKAAIKAALKYGRDLLPPKLRPWADKLYGLVDQLDQAVEGPIIMALMSQGVPYDVAKTAAEWIVTFV